MIGVQVREHNPADVGRINSQARKLRGDLVIRSELEPGEAEEGIQPWKVAGFRCLGGLTGVEKANAVSVLHDEDVDGQRLVRPIVDEVAANPTLASLAPNAAGRETLDAHPRYAKRA